MLKKTIENPLTVALLAEKLSRNWQRFDPLSLAHEKQKAFIQDESLFVSAVCSRRSGKTFGVVLKMLEIAKRYPESTVLYIGLTRQDAKGIVLPYLKKLKKQIGLPLLVKDHTNEVKLPNGSKIQLASSDMDALAERFRGKNFPLVCIDEAQAFRIDLGYLVNEVLAYCVSDWRERGAGQIYLTGTPSAALSGYFYEATNGVINGWSRHKWTIFDNPHFANPMAFLQELLEKSGLKDDDPKVQREFYGEWVASNEELVYQIPDSTVTDRLPMANDWVTIIGFDLAFAPDATAFVVLRYSQALGKVAFVYAEAFERMIIEDVATTLKDLQRRFGAGQIVGDLGALGKMIGEELIRRYALPVRAADKKAKEYFIKLFNSDLKTGNVLFLSPQTEDLLKQARGLSWVKVARKDNGLKEDPLAKNDLCDAMLYAWRHCYHYVRKMAADLSPEDRLEQQLEKKYAKKTD
jgi:hypothetical protein